MYFKNRDIESERAKTFEQFPHHQLKEKKKEIQSNKNQTKPRCNRCTDKAGMEARDSTVIGNQIQHNLYPDKEVGSRHITRYLRTRSSQKRVNLFPWLNRARPPFSLAVTVQPVCDSDWLKGIGHSDICLSDWLKGIGHSDICLSDWLKGIRHSDVCLLRGILNKNF